jgi:hypothetical protein
MRVLCLCVCACVCVCMPCRGNGAPILTEEGAAQGHDMVDVGRLWQGGGIGSEHAALAGRLGVERNLTARNGHENSTQKRIEQLGVQRTSSTSVSPLQADTESGPEKITESAVACRRRPSNTAPQQTRSENRSTHNRGTHHQQAQRQPRAAAVCGGWASERRGRVYALHVRVAGAR